MKATGNRSPSSPGPAARLLAWFGVLAVLGALLSLVFLRLAPRMNFEGVWEYRALFIQGWWTTLTLSATALFFACLSAPLWTTLRALPLPATRFFSTLVVELCRGTPFWFCC